MAGSKDKQAEPTKRPRLAQTDQAMASAPRPRRAIRPLTMTELTRRFLAHEDELQTILHQLSMVHKLPEDGPLAVALVEAVQAWLQVHRPGKAHPSGSISSAVAGVLFPYLLNSKRPGEITEAQWDGFTSAIHALTSSVDPPATACTNAKKKARAYQRTLPTTVPLCHSAAGLCPQRQPPAMSSPDNKITEEELLRCIMAALSSKTAAPKRPAPAQGEEIIFADTTGAGNTESTDASSSTGTRTSDRLPPSPPKPTRQPKHWQPKLSATNSQLRKEM